MFIDTEDHSLPLFLSNQRPSLRPPSKSPPFLLSPLSPVPLTKTARPGLEIFWNSLPLVFIIRLRFISTPACAPVQSCQFCQCYAAGLVEFHLWKRWSSSFGNSTGSLSTHFFQLLVPAPVRTGTYSTYLEIDSFGLKFEKKNGRTVGEHFL
jgi:hypothetical protein